MEKVNSMKDRLMEIILAKSFQYSEEPTFKLVSGGVSNFYFNCKPTMLDPEGKELIGRLIFSRIRELQVAGIGGLELGSVPISSAVSLISQLEGQPIKEFIVRKEKKDHGIPAKVEGEWDAGEKVVVVDDVITTGGSTIKAIEAVQKLGLEVAKVVVLVDREEMNGRQNIEKLCPQVEPLIKRTEVMALYKERIAQSAKRGAQE
ncbi:MAG: orotate phosphoribosyltransferase [Deltaproteobacteria bacterium]|nr:orotate phosphoribosyltransferase [Deltaproteobacteria bacterium]